MLERVIEFKFGGETKKKGIVLKESYGRQKIVKAIILI